MNETPEDAPRGKFKFGLLQAVIVAALGVGIAVATAIANNGL